MTSPKKRSNVVTYMDVVVVGAGFSGLYMLHRLREAGFSTRVYDAAAGVGGTWYWNRYPGARCDSESIYYNYTFSEELLQEWTWSARYPEQPEVLRYLNFVADKFKLRRDIQFETHVTAAQYEDTTCRWLIQMDDGSRVSAQYFITAVGCLSAANRPNIKGMESFKGDMYDTGHWPHEKVDFKGKRVGVIGTGLSGVQSIPVIAQEAAHLTVFQRTPQYSIPARNHPYDPEYVQQTKENYCEIKQKMRESTTGIPGEPLNRSALEDTPEERQKVYEKAWENGEIYAIGTTYNDLSINAAANATVAEFARSKISEIVDDPEIAEKLKATYYYGTKRPIADSGYYETYNRNNVTLVDLKESPIQEITSTGLRTTAAEVELDVLVFATGFDAMTGSLLKIDIQGKNSVRLKEKWANGKQTKTYLGIANAGFPNMFMITGPESPSVLSNMPVSIEQHVEWVADCIEYLCKNGVESIEANESAEDAWSKHCREIAEATLFTKAESGYLGANIDDKPRGFQIYLGGVGAYREKCTEIAANDYEGFVLTPIRKTMKR